MTALLEVKKLSKAFGGVRAVNDVSFEVAAGELLALIGPNGAGKSTCFNMLNGQLRPDAGLVRFEGRDIAGMNDVFRVSADGGTPMVVAAAGEVVPEGELVAPFTTAASDEHDATPNVARINSTAAFLIAPPMWSTSRFYHGASRSPVW